MVQEYPATPPTLRSVLTLEERDGSVAESMNEVAPLVPNGSRIIPPAMTDTLVLENPQLASPA